MRQGIEARTIVAEMELGFLPPVRCDTLTRNYHIHRRGKGDEEITILRDYLEEFLLGKTGEVNAMGIAQVLRPVLSDLRRQPEVHARSLIAEANASFATDPVNTQEIRDTTVAAFDRMVTARGDRSTVSRALVLCRCADDVLESAEKAVTEFLCDRQTAPGTFKTAAERDRLAKRLLVDLMTDRRYLATLRSELVALDERYSDAREELLRALATINMFNNLGKQDHQVGTHLNKPPPGPAVFASGSVRTRFPNHPNG